LEVEMHGLPRQLLIAARERHGLITVTELHEARVVGRARSNALADGLLVPVHRGVYRIGSHADSFEQRCLAACLAARGAVLAGPTAGRIMGVRKVFTDEIHVIARTTIQLRGVVAHRTDLLGPGDIEVRGDLRLLKPARLVCDLARHLDDAALESVIEQLIDRRLVSVPVLRAPPVALSAPGGRVRSASPGSSSPDPQGCSRSIPTSSCDCGALSLGVACGSSVRCGWQPTVGPCSSTSPTPRCGWGSRSTT
jgi:hypothetical protein